MESPARLWRPAAQRNLRNSWSFISAACSSWNSASASGLSAATGLVNAYLTQRYMASMDLGVLSDMKGIRFNAEKKLHDQQIDHLGDLIAAYKGLEETTSKLVHESKSMRTYAKDSGRNVIAFSKDKVFQDDSGDGNGIPVFSTLTIRFYESLAEEIAKMHLMELKIKWLIVSELKSAVSDQTQELPLDSLRALHCALLCQKTECSLSCKDFLQLQTWKSSSDVGREVLEVYLATWLAEVSLNRQRLDEILASVNEEMTS